MAQDAAKKRPLSEWQTQVIRCTTFFRPQAGITPTPVLQKLWRDITGEEPDSVVQKPKEGVVVVEGSFGKAGLILVGRVNGFDLRLQAPAAVPKEDEALPGLGGFESLCKEFSSSAGPVLMADVPAGVNRVAFGAVVHLTVPGRIEAYHQLAPYLPGNIACPENLYEFMYRCNRRRDSSLLGASTYVNRLSTWAVANIRMVCSPASEAESPRQVMKTAWIIQLELDINTSADRVDPLPSDKLVDVFGELMDMGREIALEGDIL